MIVVDGLLALALAVLAVRSAVYARPVTDVALTMTLSVLTAAPIALRQVMPVGALSVVLAANLGLSVLNGHSFPEGGIGVAIAVFTVATLSSRTVALAMFAVSVVAVSASMIVVSGQTVPEQVVWSEVLKGLISLVIAGGLGASTRRWAERAERSAARAERAAANERVRIARELHDVVAHHMSVISLQAGVSRYLLDTDPVAARSALSTVEESSHEALSEMRRLLEVLRPETEYRERAADYHPQPGLAELDGLVERTRAAGVPVDVTVSGRMRPLPPGPDLCAYRVIQESLTNVLKHAGPATARVDLDYGENTLTLRVLDDGTGPVPVGSSAPAASRGPARADGAASHGIRGMRERAELYGGVLDAGPQDAGGFGVTARLPIGTT